ncbi:MAG: hypothetical protein HC792_01865 [Acaryochloridaceae cyanobacterium CSU_5_19]|nr:hypothetical protein [Acaryochloridaceae cyanobacterium CSU_5_19]
MGRGISCPWLSLADAEFILSRYHFTQTLSGDSDSQTYYSGPFVLVASNHPREITLSVPCDSVQGF